MSGDFTHRCFVRRHGSVGGMKADVMFQDLVGVADPAKRRAGGTVSVAAALSEIWSATANRDKATL